MRLNRMTTMFAGAALVVASVVAAAPANASTPAEEYHITDSRVWDPIVAATDVENRVFDYEQAVADGAPENVARDFAKGFFSGGGSVIGVPGVVVDAALTTALEELAACRGRNQYWTDGWGFHWEMDSCGGYYLKNAITAGTSASTVIGGLIGLTGVGLPATAIGALIGVWGLIAVPSLDSCLYPGRGITVHWTFGIWWCGAQS